jgi:NADPH2:quinone reductase
VLATFDRERRGKIVVLPEAVIGSSDAG